MTSLKTNTFIAAISLLVAGCSGTPTNDITPKEAASLQTDKQAVIIDVREDSEWNQGHIPGAIHIPLGQLPSRLIELASYKNSPVIAQCQRGGRSAKAYETLKAAGFTQAYNMAGGLDAWNKAGLTK